MYLYQGARIKTLGARSRCQPQDVSTTPIKDLLILYKDVYLELKNALYVESQWVSLRDIPASWRLDLISLTVVQWLNTLGSSALPTTQPPPIEVIYAPYREAIQAGYNVEPVHPTTNPELLTPLVDRRDLRITKAGIDYKDLYEKTLVTVNGLLHRTNFVGNALHVIEGGQSSRHAKQYHAGLYFLGGLGRITSVPICEQFVQSERSGQPLKDRAIIQIDPRAGELENKSVLISIGGYLHLPGEGLISRTGEREYTINFANYPLAAHFFELRKLIDTGRIDRHLASSTVNTNQISVEELYSDNAIIALLTLSQSFFIVIDTPEIWLERTAVEWNQLPGSFITYEKPEYPLITGLGRLSEYWTSRERDRYVLSIEGGLKPNYLFETTHWKDQVSIDPSREPANLLEYTNAFFLKIGKPLN
jgi:hypothetical protein